MVYLIWTLYKRNYIYTIYSAWYTVNYSNDHCNIWCYCIIILDIFHIISTLIGCIWWYITRWEINVNDSNNVSVLVSCPSLGFKVSCAIVTSRCATSWKETRNPYVGRIMIHQVYIMNTNHLGSIWQTSRVTIKQKKWIVVSWSGNTGWNSLTETKRKQKSQYGSCHPSDLNMFAIHWDSLSLSIPPISGCCILNWPKFLREKKIIISSWFLGAKFQVLPMRGKENMLMLMTHD